MWIPRRLAALFLTLSLLLAACATTSEPNGGGESSAANAEPAEQAESQSGLAQLEQEEPDPALSPEEVVRTQLRALQLNGDEDRGIAIAFRFASPRNKEQTGPLPRFVRMMRSPVYSPLLRSEEFTIQEVRSQGRLANIVASVTDTEGATTEYVFVLHRLQEGEYADSWMTAGVQRLQREQSEPTFESV